MIRGVALAALVITVVCGTAAGATRSGVLHGTVLLAPATPVCMPRVPCMRPAAGVVLTFSRAGRVRARATTGAEGTYRVTLAPGAYGVRVTHPSDVRRLNPATVRVVAGQSLRVTFYMDTGIR